MKTYCRLSKTATLIRNKLKFPDVVSRIIGQFCGTDLTKIPGDTYIRKGGLPNGCYVCVRSTAFAPFQRHHFKGYVYHKYKITSVTACFFKCEHMESYYVLTLGFQLDGPYTQALICREAYIPHKRFKGTKFDEAHQRHFNYLQPLFDQAIEVPLVYRNLPFLMALRFDLRKYCLVLPKNKNDSTPGHNQSNP